MEILFVLLLQTVYRNLTTMPILCGIKILTYWFNQMCLLYGTIPLFFLLIFLFDLSKPKREVQDFLSTNVVLSYVCQLLLYILQCCVTGHIRVPDYYRFTVESTRYWHKESFSLIYYLLIWFNFFNNDAVILFSFYLNLHEMSFSNPLFLTFRCDFSFSAVPSLELLNPLYTKWFFFCLFSITEGGL